MKRLCIFAHYDRDNIVDEYVLFYLANLKKVSTTIVFITTSKIDESEITKVKIYCDKVIIRDNVGYDFRSWQTGIKSVGNIADYDELIVCNDSVYGPIFPLPEIFDSMTQKDCDFWGMTDNNDIAYHLQSYFLVFKKNLMLSQVFQGFWDSVSIQKSKIDIIRKYEVGLTQTFMAAGFKPLAYAPCLSSFVKVMAFKATLALRSPFKAFRRIIRTIKGGYQEQISLNPTFFLWKDLILKHRMPFVKILTLRDGGNRINIKGYDDIIRKHSNYDTELIRKHLKRMKQKL